ncbi:unnamed protein product [Linum trigynum]|uniref:Uncharacterized protein n=1 Tax=Linum trigynum TaxID=586398 RepID=A0AAV2GNX6_9ROSI
MESLPFNFRNFLEFVTKLGSVIKVLAAFPRLINVDMDQGSEVEEQWALVLLKSSTKGSQDECSGRLKAIVACLGFDLDDPFGIPLIMLWLVESYQL